MILPKKLPDVETVRQIVADFPDVDPELATRFLPLATLAATWRISWERWLARRGLSLGRFALLAQLYLAEPRGLTPSELAERVLATRATITGLLDVLEADGLVERSRLDRSDRRKVMVRLTEKGHAVISQMMPMHFARLTRAMSVFTHEEAALLAALVERLESSLKELPDD